MFGYCINLVSKLRSRKQHLNLFLSLNNVYRSKNTGIWFFTGYGMVLDVGLENWILKQGLYSNQISFCKENSILNQYLDPFHSCTVFTDLTSAYTPKCFLGPLKKETHPCCTFFIGSLTCLHHPQFLSCHLVASSLS